MTNSIEINEAILPALATAKALGITKGLLLSYEKRGIIEPKKIKGNHYYSLNDLDKLRKIKGN